MLFEIPFVVRRVAQLLLVIAKQIVHAWCEDITDGLGGGVIRGRGVGAAHFGLQGCGFGVGCVELCGDTTAAVICTS